MIQIVRPPLAVTPPRARPAPENALSDRPDENPVTPAFGARVTPTEADVLPYVSPPPAPWPRVFPGL